jgi:hypothetical protein
MIMNEEPEGTWQESDAIYITFRGDGMKVAGN